MKSLHIRPATAEDTAAIFELIKGLAEFEKLSHEVVGSESQLKATLFGEQSFAEVVIAEWENKAVGFALFFHSYSTFLAQPGIYLEDLFVMPEYRSRGIGKSLLTHLAQTAVERNCGRLEWSVLDWNKDAIRFYKSLGAEPMDEWTTFRLTGPSLRSLGA